GQLKSISSDPSLNSTAANSSFSLSETNGVGCDSIGPCSDQFDQPSSLKDTGQDLIAKKLLLGISRATDNVNLVSKVRSEFAHDFRREKSSDSIDGIIYSVDAPDYTFT